MLGVKLKRCSSAVYMEKWKLLLFGFPGEYGAEQEREADLWGKAGDFLQLELAMEKDH